MEDVNPNISIITLNVNELNTLIKRQIVRQDKNQDPMRCCLQETNFTFKSTSRLKVKG